jgi:DNA (cytosine-5)-methyltransferase 1
MSLPIPNPEICGATNQKYSHWDWVSRMYGDLSDNQSSMMVMRKYFNDSEESISNCPKVVFDLCIKQNSNCTACPLRFNCSSYKSREKEKDKIFFADFFCGAGGLSLGLEEAGLQPKIANDIDPWFVHTYAFNRPKVDIEYFSDSIKNWLLINKSRKDFGIDLVCGGVPCQSYSMANRQQKKNDSREYLYKDLINATKIINPKILLIENVGGIIKNFEKIQKDFEGIGFHLGSIILNAKDFKIPQNRKRLFIFGYNKSKINDYENANETLCNEILRHKSTDKVTLKDAIDDLPPLEAYRKKNNTKFNNSTSGYSLYDFTLEKSSAYVKSINNNRMRVPLFNHKARYNNDRDIQIFGLLKEGENSLSKSIQKLNPYRNRNSIFKDKFYKLEKNKVCKTITAHMRYDCNMYVHPSQARGLTAREAARVQSFPDDYVFLGTFQRTYQQIGNAVPPKLANIIGRGIKEII